MKKHHFYLLLIVLLSACSVDNDESFTENLQKSKDISDSVQRQNVLCSNTNTDFFTNYTLCNNSQSSIADIESSSSYGNSFGSISYLLSQVFYFNQEFSIIGYGPSHNFDDVIVVGFPSDNEGTLYEIPEYDSLFGTTVFQRLESDNGITPLEANEIRDFFICRFREKRDSFMSPNIETLQIFDVNFSISPSLCAGDLRRIAAEFKIGVTYHPIKN